MSCTLAGIDGNNILGVIKGLYSISDYERFFFIFFGQKQF